MTHRSEVPVASRGARKDFDGSEFMFLAFCFGPLSGWLAALIVAWRPQLHSFTGSQASFFMLHLGG